MYKMQRENTDIHKQLDKIVLLII